MVRATPLIDRDGRILTTMRRQRTATGLAAIGCLLLVAACSSDPQRGATPPIDLMVTSSAPADASPSGSTEPALAPSSGSPSSTVSPTSATPTPPTSAPEPTTAPTSSVAGNQAAVTPPGSGRRTTTTSGLSRASTTTRASAKTTAGVKTAAGRSATVTPSAAAVKGLAGSAAIPVSPLVLGPGTESAQEAEVVRLVNQQRTAAGCAAVTVNPILVTVARAHSQEMSSSTEGIKHNGNDGRTPFQRMIAAGYPYSLAAENIAAGQSTAGAVMAAWLDSELHRDNILNCGLRQIGVGMVYKPGSEYGTYWTQDLGTPM